MNEIEEFICFIVLFIVAIATPLVYALICPPKSKREYKSVVYKIEPTEDNIYDVIYGVCYYEPDPLHKENNE